MSNDKLAQQLHDKFTRGESLSKEEDYLLENWYAAQDNAESMTLGFVEDEKTVSSLHAQIESTLAQLTVATARIQKIASENKALRDEVGHLRQQLAYQPAIQLT